MPDFPYLRNRNWVNEEDGPTSTDPVADDVWFEAVEAAIHQGQDHEKLAPVNPAADPADKQPLVWNEAEGWYEPGEAAGGGGGSSVVLVARLSANYVGSGAIPFDSALKDAEGMLSQASAGHIVFPSAGLYRVSAALHGYTGDSSEYFGELYFEQATGSAYPKLDARRRMLQSGYTIAGSRIIDISAANDEWFVGFYLSTNLTDEHTFFASECELVIERV